MKRDFFDFDNRIYQPFWVKAVVLLMCFGWGFVELRNGNAFWAALFLGLGVYCVWGFFIRKSGDK